MSNAPEGHGRAPPSRSVVRPLEHRLTPVLIATVLPEVRWKSGEAGRVAGAFARLGFVPVALLLIVQLVQTSPPLHPPWATVTLPEKRKPTFSVITTLLG